MPGESSAGLRAKLLRVMAEKVRAQDRLLEEYARRVLEVYPEAEIYLVESRARGDFLPYSDYDVVIILPGSIDRVGKTAELRRLKPRG